MASGITDTCALVSVHRVFMSWSWILSWICLPGSELSVFDLLNKMTLTKAVDMGHVWPKTGNDKGLYMVHM